MRLRDVSFGQDVSAATSVWRWQVQLEQERASFPWRIVRAVLITTAWLVLAPLPYALPGWAVAALIATWAGLAIEGGLLYRWPHVIEPVPWGGAVMHFVLTTTWIYVTGGGRSPFLPLLFLGVASVAGRLPPASGLVASGAYATAYRVLAGPAAWLGTAILLLMGLGQCARAATAAKARRNAVRDGLTGCYERRYGLFLIERLLARHAFPCTIGLVDLDGFKAVNDNYGHETGDRVLTGCVQSIVRLLRPEDVLARYGGDELLMVLPDTGLADAVTVAERVRAGIAEMSFRVRSDHTGAVRITVSLGLVEARAGCILTHLLCEADDALYAAKAEHNRVVCAPAPSV